MVRTAVFWVLHWVSPHLWKLACLNVLKNSAFSSERHWRVPHGLQNRDIPQYPCPYPMGVVRAQPEQPLPYPYMFLQFLASKLDDPTYYWFGGVGNGDGKAGMQALAQKNEVIYCVII